MYMLLFKYRILQHLQWGGGRNTSTFFYNFMRSRCSSFFLPFSLYIVRFNHFYNITANELLLIRISTYQVIFLYLLMEDLFRSYADFIFYYLLCSNALFLLCRLQSYQKAIQKAEQSVLPMPAMLFFNRYNSNNALHIQ